MDVGFPQAGIGNPHKLAVTLQFSNSTTTGVTHAGTQTADQLVDITGQGAAERYPPFDPFRHQLDVLFFRLEVTILAPLLHRSEAAHPTIGFVGSALIKDGFARGFFVTAEQRAD